MNDEEDELSDPCTSDPSCWSPWETDSEVNDGNPCSNDPACTSQAEDDEDSSASDPCSDDYSCCKKLNPPCPPPGSEVTPIPIAQFLLT